MRSAWRLRNRLLMALMFAGAVVVAAAAQQQPAPAQPAAGQAPPPAGGRGNFMNNFTGTVAVQQTQGMNMSRIRFEMGARTNWHLHSAGQLLLVEEGRGRWQELGKPVQNTAAGQPVYLTPNVVHWHGAAPDSHAVQFSVYSGTLEWKQAVTDAEYAGK
jgi:quercetin dioxygenase-like cupin family protein